MPTYQVGYDENTWEFNDAIGAANPGDVLEIQKNYFLNFSTDTAYEINKNLTFLGLLDEEDGESFFTNKFQGTISLDCGASVVFENIWFTNLKDTTLMIIHENCSATFKNCVFECTEEDNESYLIYAKEGSFLTFEQCKTSFVSDSGNQSIYLQNSSFTAKDSFFQFRMITEGAELKLSNTICENYFGNALYLQKNTGFEAENCQFYGGNLLKSYPMIWVEDSYFRLENGIIGKMKRGQGLYAGDKSEVSLTNVTAHSLDVRKSIFLLEDCKIMDSVFLGPFTYCYAQSVLSFLCESESSIPLRLYNGSTIFADQVLFEKALDVNIEATSSSLVHVCELMYANGSSSELNINTDEFSKMSADVRHTTAAGAEGNENAPKELDSYEELQNLFGLEVVKKEIDTLIGMVDYNKQRVLRGEPPQQLVLHSLFMGNPGTGKTTVARLMGKILFERGALFGDTFKFVEVSESDLLSGYVNQTTTQTLAKLEEARGGVLFIDEAYSLDKKSTNDTGKEAITTILKYMEDHKNEIMIIFAGYTKEMEQFLQINPGLTSRVPNRLNFEDYSPEQIVQMGIKGLQKNRYEIADVEYYTRKVTLEYNRSLDRSNARWIRNFNEKIIKQLIARVIAEKSEDISLITNADIDAVLEIGKYQDNGTKKDAWQELHQLIGLHKVKEQVEDFIAQAEMNRKREQEGFTTSATTLHSLFLGNPGTGKTTVARIVAELLYQKGLIATNKLIEVSRGDLIGAYQGQTAIKTREQLQAALGGVLFIDEAYSLKHGSGDNFGQEAIDEILKFMEDHRRDMVVIFAGYHKEMAEFLESNSGLKSRVPTTFDFEDYSPDEIAQIGEFILQDQGYQYDAESYRAAVKEAYAVTDDHSNGRWIRNFNQKLLAHMSRRVTKDESSDFNTITSEDLEKMREA